MGNPRHISRLGNDEKLFVFNIEEYISKIKR